MTPFHVLLIISEEGLKDKIEAQLRELLPKDRELVLHWERKTEHGVALVLMDTFPIELIICYDTFPVHAPEDGFNPPAKTVHWEQFRALTTCLKAFHHREPTIRLLRPDLHDKDVTAGTWDATERCRVYAIGRPSAKKLIKKLTSSSTP
ncbi:MAG TPA: hypothetical protein VJB64_01215 [Patescibacteria group bacterium]|nr:hypothetical protein [Patescibacteria group bacterium]